MKKTGTVVDLVLIWDTVDSSSHSIVFQMMASALIGVSRLYIPLTSVGYLVKPVVNEIGRSLNLRGCSSGAGSCNIHSVMWI